MKNQIVTVRGKVKIEVVFDKLPQSSVEQIFAYGLQRIVNDAAGKVGKRDDYMTEESYEVACMAIAEAKIATLYTGVQRAGALEREAKRIAVAILPKGSARVAEIAASPKVIAQAKVNLAAQAALSVGEQTLQE